MEADRAPEPVPHRDNRARGIVKDHQDAAGLLTAFDVARELNVSPKTVHEWARAGTIAYVRLPSGRLRFSRAVVNAILEPVED